MHAKVMKRIATGLLLYLHMCASYTSIQQFLRNKMQGSSSTTTTTTTTTTTQHMFANNGEFDPTLITLYNEIDRVYCLSDLHTDHPVNMEWLRQNMPKLNDRDLLIVAGDISHKPSVLRETFELLRQHCKVFFTFGNHEAWLLPEELTSKETSLQKLDKIYQLCKECDIYTDPIRISNSDSDASLFILPLPSWYDGSLCQEPLTDLCKDFDTWPWVDFIRCEWPLDDFPRVDRIPQGLVSYFEQCNKPNVELVKRKINPQTDTMITVSHFLPNFQSLPDWKNLTATRFDVDNWLDHGAGSMSAKFSKVAGTVLLDEQIRALDAQVHIFGHSHRPKDFVLPTTTTAIRYIHHPLGKPREREMYMVSPRVDFKLVWAQNKVVPASKQVLRLWEEEGGGKEALQERIRMKKSIVSGGSRYRD